MNKTEIEKIINDYSEIKKELKTLNGIGWLAKKLRTDIGLTITIISFASIILSGYYSFKNDIALINEKTSTIQKTVDEIKMFMSDSEKDRAQLNNRLSVVESFMKNLGLKL